MSISKERPINLFTTVVPLAPIAPEVTPQVKGEVAGEVTGEVTGEVAQLLRGLTEPKTRAELQRDLGLKSQANFRDRYLMPTLASGLIEMTIPDKPRSSKQRYKITDLGLKMLDHSKEKKLE